MAVDLPRTVPQPVVEPAATDAVLPTPRSSPEPSAHDIPRPTPRPPLEPAARDLRRSAPRQAQGSRAGWILSAFVAVMAAWVVGWAAGAAWAWRRMMPWPLGRSPKAR